MPESFNEWIRRRFGTPRPPSEWRKGYDDDGIVSAQLTPGQVVLPPGSPVTDEEARALNGADTEIIRLEENP